MGKGTRSAVLAKKAIRRGKPVKISKIASKQVPLADQQQYVRLQQAGDVAACLSLAEAFTRDHPESAFAWKTLASSLLKSDRLDEAEEAIERAASLVVDDPEIHNNRGSIYFAQGRESESEREVRRALELKPDFERPLLWLTQRLRDRGAFPEALELLDAALERRPDDYAWRKLRATMLVRSGRFTCALSTLESLAEEAPDDSDVHEWLGHGYYHLGNFGDGEASFERAMALAPDNALIHSGKLLFIHYDPDVSPETIREAHLEWDRKYRPSSVRRARATDLNPGRRLRIGLLSAGLRLHPVGQMIASALQFLPRDDIELFIYSMSDKVDPYTEVIRTRSDSWSSVIRTSDDKLEEQIRGDRVDILLDLCGHTDGTRCRVIAREPAPLIVKWVGGQINTTGLSAMDYMLSDSVETPPGVDSEYVEKLIRLPDDYICYVPRGDAPEVGPLPALDNGFITFGCFNNPMKINPELIGQWSELMRQLPGSKLFLKGAAYDSSDRVAQVTAIFEENGIAAEQLIFEPRSPHKELLECYNRVDIALDSWPYSGGLTTCEALLMGVPVITRPGPTFAGRHSATHLTNAGLEHLVVDNWDELRDLAVALASDLTALSELRQSLRQKLKQSPVCDPHRFARNLNIALRAIWQRHCDGKSPAALTFSDDRIATFEGDESPVEVVINEMPDPRAAKPDAKRRDFDWSLPREIVGIDCGGRLFNSPGFSNLVASGAFTVIGFDPASRVGDMDEGLDPDRYQLFRHSVLGDGKPARLHACLDGDFSSVLEPRPKDQLPRRLVTGSTVLTTLPIATVALDDISGLEHLDWLVLDEHCHTLDVLRCGEKTLRDCLVIQVRVLNEARYVDQSSPAGIIEWALGHGFVLHRIDSVGFEQACSRQVEGLAPSQLVAMDLLFVPDVERRQHLDLDRRRLLGCLLQTVYGISDLPYELLRECDPEVAERFHAAVRDDAPEAGPTQRILREDPTAPTDATDASDAGISTFVLPGAPHMSAAERVLFRRYLEKAGSYYEFGAGGSTVWAVEQGLTVHGVESDAAWVDALREKLGAACQLEAVDIGKTGQWGMPVSDAASDRFPNYSLAIDDYETPFDLVLVDGRFRVACVMRAILHLLRNPTGHGAGYIFIHDFWNRPHYHVVLDFLEEVERAGTAGVFQVRTGVDTAQVEKLWTEYRKRPA